MRTAHGVVCGLLMVLGLGLLGGCFKAEARLPEQINIGGSGYGHDVPPEPVTPAAPGDAAGLARENRQLRRQNADLIRQLNAAEARLKDVHEDLDRSEKEIEDLEERIEDLEDKLDDD